MNLLQDILTYIRRIIKSPSNAQITDNLLIDYVNRFWIMDVDARMQLFDLKTKYQFQTSPGVDQYNMPLYSVQSETPGNPTSQDIGMYPVYQGFLNPAYINGVLVPIQTQKQSFFNSYPNVTQQLNIIATGNGTNSYNIQLPILSQSGSNPPFQGILRGHVDITGIMSTNVNIDPPFYSAFNSSIPVTSTFPAFYLTTLDANGNNIIVADSGQFLTGSSGNMPNYGLLMTPGPAPYGNAALDGGYYANITGVTQATLAVITATNTFGMGQYVTISGVEGMTQLNGNTYQIVSASATQFTINVNSTAFTAYISGGTAISNYVNYFTGEVNVTFPVAIPSGNNINCQCYYFQTGLPRQILYYNNVITLRSPPDKQYLVELDAYLSPAAFFNTTAAIPFGYMSEYIARGAARKILADTGDIEQFNFYEQFFREQEMLVWKRSQRQWTNNRTETIYSRGLGHGDGGNSNLGGVSI